MSGASNDALGRSCWQEKTIWNLLGSRMVNLDGDFGGC